MRQAISAKVEIVFAMNGCRVLFMISQQDAQFPIVDELCWTEKELPQKERTKHVHSIHQYMGKYVPQLVDYFLERDLKDCSFILDPFVGSGTTLVQCNIHQIPSIGIDISQFNIMLTNVKTREYNIPHLTKEIEDILEKLCTHDNLDKSSKIFFKTKSEYLNKWYAPSALEKLLYFCKQIPNYHYQDVLRVIVSRAARSSRMAPHYELDFPKEPQDKDYHCHKHSRICHPTTNSLIFIKRYCRDVLQRITEFQKLRNDVYTETFNKNSMTFNFTKHISKVDGIITSPPYVGLIDYHEQHRYAYELFDLADRSDNEIGKKKNGTGRKAVQEYKKNMTQVFKNISENIFDHKKGKIIIVVNDKLNLYEEIMHDSGLGISKRLKRRVDRRTGRRATGFFEDIIIWDAKTK